MTVLKINLERISVKLLTNQAKTIPFSKAKKLPRHLIVKPLFYIKRSLKCKDLPCHSIVISLEPIIQKLLYFCKTNTP